MTKLLLCFIYLDIYWWVGKMTELKVQNSYFCHPLLIILLIIYSFTHLLIIFLVQKKVFFNEYNNTYKSIQNTYLITFILIFYKAVYIVYNKRLAPFQIIFIFFIPTDRISFSRFDYWVCNDWVLFKSAFLMLENVYKRVDYVCVYPPKMLASIYLYLLLYNCIIIMLWYYITWPPAPQKVTRVGDTWYDFETLENVCGVICYWSKYLSNSNNNVKNNNHENGRQN